jgi:hypothetical protein
MLAHRQGLYTLPWIPRGSARNMRIPYGVRTHPCGILPLHLSNSTRICAEYDKFTRTPRNSAVRVREGLERTAARCPSITSPHSLSLPSTTSTDPPPPLTSAHHIETRPAREKTRPTRQHATSPRHHIAMATQQPDAMSHVATATQQPEKATTRHRKHSEHDGKDTKGVEHNRRCVQGTPPVFFVYMPFLITF